MVDEHFHNGDCFVTNILRVLLANEHGHNVNYSSKHSSNGGASSSSRLTKNQLHKLSKKHAAQCVEQAVMRPANSQHIGLFVNTAVDAVPVSGAHAKQDSRNKVRFTTFIIHWSDVI